jgi:hypothetical protein
MALAYLVLTCPASPDEMASDGLLPRPWGTNLRKEAGARIRTADLLIANPTRRMSEVAALCGLLLLDQGEPSELTH